jgi:hypothetical protein
LNILFVPQIKQVGAAIVAGIADQRRINRRSGNGAWGSNSGLICLSASIEQDRERARAGATSHRRVSSFRDEEFPVSKISAGSLACGLDYRHPRVAGKNAGNG